MKNKYSKGELSKEILKGLALGGFVVACFVAPAAPVPTIATTIPPATTSSDVGGGGEVATTTPKEI